MTIHPDTGEQCDDASHEPIRLIEESCEEFQVLDLQPNLCRKNKKFPLEISEEQNPLSQKMPSKDISLSTRKLDQTMKNCVTEEVNSAVNNVKGNLPDHDYDVQNVLIKSTDNNPVSYEIPSGCMNNRKDLVSVEASDSILTPERKEPILNSRKEETNLTMRMDSIDSMSPEEDKDSVSVTLENVHDGKDLIDKGAENLHPESEHVESVDFSMPGVLPVDAQNENEKSKSEKCECTSEEAGSRTDDAESVTDKPKCKSDNADIKNTDRTTQGSTMNQQSSPNEVNKSADNEILSADELSTLCDQIKMIGIEPKESSVGECDSDDSCTYNLEGRLGEMYLYDSDDESSTHKEYPLTGRSPFDGRGVNRRKEPGSTAMSNIVYPTTPQVYQQPILLTNKHRLDDDSAEPPHLFMRVDRTHREPEEHDENSSDTQWTPCMTSTMTGGIVTMSENTSSIPDQVLMHEIDRLNTTLNCDEQVPDDLSQFLQQPDLENTLQQEALSQMQNIAEPVLMQNVLPSQTVTSQSVRRCPLSSQHQAVTQQQHLGSQRYLGMSTQQVISVSSAQPQAKQGMCPQRQTTSQGITHSGMLHQTMSPQQQIMSPQHQIMSPQQQIMSPQHQIMSPQQQAMSPQQQAMSPQQQAMSPQQQAMSPQQQAVSPQHQIMSPQQQAMSPQHQTVSPQQLTMSPQHLTMSPQQLTMSPQQQAMPQQQQAMSLQQQATSQQQQAMSLQHLVTQSAMFPSQVHGINCSMVTNNVSMTTSVNSTLANDFDIVSSTVDDLCALTRPGSTESIMSQSSSEQTIHSPLYDYFSSTSDQTFSPGSSFGPTSDYDTSSFLDDSSEPSDAFYGIPSPKSFIDEQEQVFQDILQKVRNENEHHRLTSTCSDSQSADDINDMFDFIQKDQEKAVDIQREPVIQTQLPIDILTQLPRKMKMYSEKIPKQNNPILVAKRLTNQYQNKPNVVKMGNQHQQKLSNSGGARGNVNDLVKKDVNQTPVNRPAANVSRLVPIAPKPSPVPENGKYTIGAVPPAQMSGVRYVQPVQMLRYADVTHNQMSGNVRLPQQERPDVVPVSQRQECNEEDLRALSTVSTQPIEALLVQDEDGDSVIHIMVIQHELYLLKALLNRFSRENMIPKWINITNHEAQTALYIAMTSQPDEGKPNHQQEMIEELVKHGADVNIQCHNGTNPGDSQVVYQSIIHLAAFLGRHNILRVLLTSPTADVNKANNILETPLHCAIKKHGCIQKNGQKRDCRLVIKLLREAGADFTIKTKMNGTLLHMVAEKGDHELLSFLLNYIPQQELSSIINEQDDNGNTALHLAACSMSQVAPPQNGIKEMITEMLNKGADSRIKNRHNQTAATFLPKTQIGEQISGLFKKRNNSGSGGRSRQPSANFS